MMQGTMSQSGEGRIVETLERIQRNEALLMEAFLNRFSWTPVSDYSPTTADGGWHPQARDYYSTSSCLVLQNLFPQWRSASRPTPRRKRIFSCRIFVRSHGGWRQQVGTPSFQPLRNISLLRKASTSSRANWTFRSTILTIADCFCAICSIPFKMEIGLWFLCGRKTEG